MSIEVVSWPKDLRTWDGEKQPFYLELFGETRPLVNPHVAELQGGSDNTPPAPIYEYAWTIGHKGYPKQHEGMLGGLLPPEGFWQSLDDPAARVYVYFPVNCGWRVSELTATVKYLTPVYEHESFMKKVAEDWTTIQPLVDDAAKLAAALPDPAASAASASAKMLGVLAQLQIGSVPTDGTFKWSAGKVADGNAENGVMEGVMWTLPKNMFQDLGGRLTGTLAVTYVPVNQQGDVVGPQDAEALRSGVVRAHAWVCSKGNQVWAPAKNDFVKLAIAPQLASTPPAPPKS